MIELKMIDLMIFDSMTKNLMQNNSMTIALIALIKQLIEMLIELLIAIEKFVVERLVIELIEKFLIELICAHVNTFEIDSITIEILIDIRIENDFFNAAIFFRLKNNF